MNIYTFLFGSGQAEWAHLFLYIHGHLCASPNGRCQEARPESRGQNNEGAPFYFTAQDWLLPFSSHKNVHVCAQSVLSINPVPLCPWVSRLHGVRRTCRGLHLACCVWRDLPHFRPKLVLWCHAVWGGLGRMPWGTDTRCNATQLITVGLDCIRGGCIWRQSSCWTLLLSFIKDV